jgi:hypothetical protein
VTDPVTAATAIALVALREWDLWWILPLGVLAGALALAGYLAPARRHASWIRVYAHGQGGAFIALVTALFVVSLSGPAATAAWIVPTLVGVALIERRVSRLKAHPGAATSPSATPARSSSRAPRTESKHDT